MLKFSNSSASLLALLIGLSMPLFAAGGDNNEETLSTVLGVKPSSPEDLSYVQNFFIPDLKSNTPILDIQLLKKEIISVSLSHLKSPGNPNTLSKVDTLQSLMDVESQRNLRNEDLQIFLFKVYSGQILKNSIFVSSDKTTTLLVNARNQMWGWAFWERAKSNPKHATVGISPDHLRAANLECADAINYVSTQLGYVLQSTENLCRSILKIFSESTPDESKRPSAENVAIKQMAVQINSFHKYWKSVGYARPLMDFVFLIGKNSSDTRLKSICSEFLVTAAKLENPHAKTILGNRAFALAEIAFKKNNTDDLMKFLRLAVQYDHTKAMSMYGYQLFKQGKQKEAIEYFTKAAAKGDITALYNLGAIHMGMGNIEESKKCLFKAAEFGNIPAMYKLGCIYSKEGNTEQEQKWFLAAAKKGDPSAMFNLARSYTRGSNFKEAHDWLLESALSNSDSAMFQLGLLYIKTGNVQDGSFWMHKAASLGNKHANEVLDLAEKLSEERELMETKISKDPEKIVEQDNPQEKPEEDSLDQDIEKIFESMESEKSVLANSNDVLLTSQPDITPSSPYDNQIAPQAIEKFETPPVHTGELSVPRPDNDKEVKNPKTRRAMLKALWQEKRSNDTNANQEKPLSDKAKIIANSILSGNSDHIQREHLETLFSDPFFSNQVRVIQTRNGFAVLAHHREKNQHINTGTHRKHGQEKFTGHIHPETRKDLKEILMLFDARSQ